MDETYEIDAVDAFEAEIESRTALPNAVVWAPLTDAGNAEVLAALVGGELLYDHRRGEWYGFLGHRWVLVHEARMLQLALDVARLRGEAGKEMVRRAESGEIGGDEDAGKIKSRGVALKKWARQSESARGLSACVRVARALDALADQGEAWDADAWLLGVPNGVVELRTGELRDGRPGDRITKQTAVAYLPGAECPKFEKLLEGALPDPDVRRWRGRYAGYSATGEVGAELLALDYGQGSNGKSVMREACRRVLGDYGWHIDASALLAERRGAHTTEIAQLGGRRLVTVSELGEDELNEPRVKGITSRDAITARLMRQDDRSFAPTHKLWMATNNLPRVSDPTEGFWRRVGLPEWPVSYPRDETLEQAIEAEAPGILAWLVRQAAEYAAHGLGPTPAAMVAMRDRYRDSEDPLAEWREARLAEDEGAFLPGADARRDYRTWSAEAGLAGRDLLSAVAFGRRLGRKYRAGQRRVGGKVVHGFEGVRLAVEAVPHAEAVSGTAPLIVVEEEV
jgi:putative DNA primase/helicase